MEAQQKFKIIYSEEVIQFLNTLSEKAKAKIMYNASKATYNLDPKIFKKLEGQDIWEFRTVYSNIQYRLLAFWDKDAETFVITTHGFIKKTQKTPLNEINRANEIRKAYFEAKQQELKQVKK